jgi:hypothetical protein
MTDEKKAEELTPLKIQYTFDEVHESLRQLHENGASFDEVRVLMVNQLHITMGEATDRIEGAEAMTGIKLARTPGTEFDYHRSVDFQVGPSIPEGVSEALNSLRAEQERISGAPRTGLDDGPPLPERTPPLPKLSTLELEHFRPKCAYCGGEIDADRARKRKRTCSDEHTRLFAQFRRYLWSMTRCPSCYRPSTPEERKEYKQWRAHRGDVLKSVGRGRPSKTREKQIETELLSIISMIDAGASETEPWVLVEGIRERLSKVINPS